MSSSIRVGEVLRYPVAAKQGIPIPEMIDGFSNFYAVTQKHGAAALKLDAGINQPASIAAVDGPRVAVIALSSSPHKTGQVITPWQDVFDIDNGHVRYFGDNRTPGKDPSTSLGNSRLLYQWNLHSGLTREERARAAPITLFRRVTRRKRPKGFVQFEGVAVLRRAELVTQSGAHGYFTNYVFDFDVLDLVAENECFAWSWINLRRDHDVSAEESLGNAPGSWRTWVTEGDLALPKIRRYVAKRSVVSTIEQKPPTSSPESEILSALYLNYKGKEAKFEAVAAWISARILGRTGTYRPQGVTRATGDRGFDFIARLDLGDGFGALKLVVLGQAKCEALGSPTNGMDVARTVARLRRGWIGVYVTTSYFSGSVQTEVIQDRYPILLINGKRLAEELYAEILRRGNQPLVELLSEIEGEYGSISEMSDPDQVLFL
jgi:hypothetical protein